jgi:predicted phosphodiesterase
VKVFIPGDLHFPHTYSEALSAAIEFAKGGGCTETWLLGDIVNGGRDDDMALAFDMYAKFRREAPPVTMVVKGNHDRKRKGDHLNQELLSAPDSFVTNGIKFSHGHWLGYKQSWLDSNMAVMTDRDGKAGIDTHHIIGHNHRLEAACHNGRYVISVGAMIDPGYEKSKSNRFPGPPRYIRHQTGFITIEFGAKLASVELFEFDNGCVQWQETVALST